MRTVSISLLEEVLLDGAHLALALELALDEQRGREGLATLRADEVHLVRGLRHVVDVLVRLAEGAAHLDLEVNDLLDFLMGALERGEEVLVAHLGGGALHHEELAADAGVEEVDVTPRLLVVRGVDHPLAVHAADADAADRAHERDLADVERGRGRVHGEEVRLARAVALDEHRVDLHVVVVPVGEQRTYRTVAHAGREDLLRARTRLALEEAARELAGGVELLAVLALEREEVDALAGRVGVGHGREDRRVAIRHGDGPGGLLGQKARLDHEVLAPDRDLELFRILHEDRPLAAKAELRDEVLVLRLVLALEVVEELAAVVDLAEQAVAGRMVLLVGLQVLRERLDLLGEKRDLHFGRARVAIMALELGTDGGFVNLHFLLLSFVICTRSGAVTPTRSARAQIRTSAGTGGRPQRGEISLDGRRNGG